MSARAAPWSLRRTLLAWLLGLTLALWGLSALIVYLEADRESQELFDQSLAETAHLLLSLADHEVQEHAAGTPLAMAVPDNRNHRQYLLFQIWSAEPRLLYKNVGAPDAAFAPPAATGFGWANVDGARWRVYTSWNDSHRLQIQLAEPLRHRKDISSRFAYKLLGFALLLAVLATLTIRWSVNRAFRALRRLADEVSRRTPNDLAEVGLAGAPDEVHPLLLAINRLFERVRRTMEHEQRFTADAAHELRTPLAAIKTNLQVIQRARSDAERDEFIGGLGVSVDRAGRLVDQLLTLSRLDPQYRPADDLAEHDLAAVLAGQLPAWQAEAERRRVTLQTELQAAPCRVSQAGVQILARNLVDNALRYTPAGGTVRLSCERDGAQVCLRVADNGPGIAPAMRERVFERFFRLADAKQPGSGLGLSIVERIAEAHGASVQLGEGLDGAGLGVEVRFPAPADATTNADVCLPSKKGV
jgi:two-component system sensor histidine kinase QseC